MKIQEFKYHSHPQFRGKLPSGTKKAIKSFTTDYLMKQDGYVSSKGSVYNGIASALRIGGGSVGTGVGIAALPEVIQHPSLLPISVETAALSTSIGAVFVGLNRLENDIAATAQAKIKVKPFVEKLKEAGFSKSDEMIYGVKQFLNKKGGFFTSIIPNCLSSRKATNVLKNSNTSEVKKWN